MDKERNLPSPIAEDDDEEVGESDDAGSEGEVAGEHEDSTPIMRPQERTMQFVYLQSILYYFS